MEFERPTPRQRLDELRIVARQMGNNPPVSFIFNGDGLVQASIGIPPRFPQDSEIPNSQSEITILKPRGSEGKSGKHNRVQPPLKPNQERHSQNLSGLNGWYKGKHYINGQPTERKGVNASGSKKNGNGRH